jgi:alanine racemase
LIHGKQAPIVGNVCMDLLMVDVTTVDCKEGDTVEFFGHTKKASAFAQDGNSISYELLSSLGPRIKRVLKD